MHLRQLANLQRSPWYQLNMPNGDDEEPINIREQVTQQEDAPPPDPDDFDYDAFEASMIDISDQHDPYYVIQKGNPDGTDKIVPYTPQMRDPDNVTGICLHQTACVMGENPPRYRRLSIHFAVTLLGVPIKICKDVLQLLYGGNDWNGGTIQIECDGSYPGLLDRPETHSKREDLETFWAGGEIKTPMRTTPAAMKTLRNLMRWIIEHCQRRGITMKVVVSHRQSSGNRESDPGQEIWVEGARPIIEEYGLHSGGVGFKLGSGRPLPDEWTGEPNGIRY